jgi:hypothetical protein
LLDRSVGKRIKLKKILKKLCCTSLYGLKFGLELG